MVLRVGQRASKLKMCTKLGESTFGSTLWSRRLGIGDEKLDLREVVIDYPIPKGVNLIEVAGALPVPEHSVFPTLAEGLFEELHPDKTTDLREPVVASFL